MHTFYAAATPGRKHFRLFLMLLCSFLCSQSLAQETINTDRPDQSDGVYTLPKNKLQLENGLTLAKETLVNNFMLRYGLSQATEIRLAVDAGREFQSRGLQPVTLSVKQKLLEQHAYFPAMTLVGYVSYSKLASRDYREATSLLSSKWRLKMYYRRRFHWDITSAQVTSLST